MSDLRTAAQQALEALLTPSGAQACSTCQNGPENEYCCRMEMWSAITALRSALAQQAEPVEPVATLTAQRDALMEVLKYLDKEFRQHGRRHWPEAVAARLAIEAVEEAK